MTWQKLPKPSTLWEEGEKWFELEDNLAEGKFDFLEYKEEPLPKGIILQRDVSVAMGPETLGTPGDLSRIWVAFTDQETGEIYLARSDAEWNQWEEYLHIIYAPSGSYQPSLTFGKDGWHRLVVTLIPAGEEIPEVWIIEPPYSGDGIRKLDLGEHPRIFQDYWGNIWVFYYKSGVGAIYSKSSKDNFASATEINLSNRGYPPLGVRTPYWEVTPYHDQFRNVLFFGSGKNMPFYVISQIEDVYTVGLDLYVIKWDGSPLEGAIVEVEGQRGITNKEGLVTFYKLPYNTIVEIKLSHPIFGEGDLSYFTISESAKGSHLYTFVYFKNPTKKHLGVRTGLTGIEWKGTEIVELPLQDKLGFDLSLGIEWESMVVFTYFLVYADSVWEPRPNILENFEGEEISSSLEFIQGSAYGWTITSDHAYSGSYSLRSDNKGKHGAANKAEITFKFQSPSGGGNVSFWYKVSSEANYDKFYVYLNGDTVINGVSGNRGWAFWEGVAPTGENTITFTYSKDGSMNRYDDCIYIDDLSLPSSELVYIPVPNATITLAGQTIQTNQDGLAGFQDLQANQLYKYEITHPDYSKVTKGQVLIPEGEFEFIPVKIYEEPWDGYALEEVKVHTDLDVNWVAIDIEYLQPKEFVSVSVGLTNILWVGLTE